MKRTSVACCRIEGTVPLIERYHTLFNDTRKRMIS